MTKEEELGQRIHNATSLDDLAETLEELLSGPYEAWPNGQLICIKVLVEAVKDVKIVIRPNDHPPPHFHALVQGRSASFEIESGRHLIGDIGPRHTRLVRDWWIGKARHRLMAIWNETRAS